MPSIVDGERLGPKYSARFRSQTGYWALWKGKDRVRSLKTSDREEAQRLVDLAQLQSDAREDDIVDCRRASAEEVIDHRIKAVHRDKVTSAAQIESTLKALRPHVAGKQLRQLDDDWLEETEEAMREEGHSYSYFWNGINFFRTGIRGYCAAKLSPPILPFKMPPRAESRKRVVASEEQVDIERWSGGNDAYDKTTRLWTPRNCISAAEAHRRLIVGRATFLGATFGSRAGIYVGLSYGPRVDGKGYFDLENGVFHRVKPGTKTSSNKRSPKVRMNPEAVEVVDGWRLVDDGCPWVFPAQDRSGPLSQERMRVIYEDAMDELGIEGVFMHVWRHTMITRMIEKGVSAPAIAAVAGVSVRMINEVYDHHDMGEVQMLAHEAMAGMTRRSRAA
ncbi:tyrosine-type recombinase/integrase [Bradyrhizobium diazoefficiens]|uniref:tyrosine-type recombinase/integrase n=1 Tax=Bradyrhizobium diazoefficiens TaxID=1355477 RepID=UPI002714C1F4|nr:tyrosine-type recombinase/integrase [Bradyrhizobium diazoefficiens]WLC16671.1 tyrosine-type recombinase/integrase [Bradyrhizobium diazoefficiens]